MDLDIIDFKSSRVTAQERKWEKEARQHILDKAKDEYEKRQAKEEAARQRGETTWMLPSVEANLSSGKSNKKKKKKEKKKKKKKEKKEKKKSKKNDSSSSSSESEEEEGWIEKSSSVVEKSSSSSSQTLQDQTTAQQPKRDDWMEMTSLFGTYSREEMHVRAGTSRKVAKVEDEKIKKEKDKPGSHALELNPFYKDGGSGLPEEQKVLERSAAPEKMSSTFDAAWLRKALKRAQDQAKEQGKSVEEIAAERWGSLEKFYELLDEAEGKGKAPKNDNRQKNRSRSRDRGSRNKRSRSRDRRRRSRSRSKDWRRSSRSRSSDRQIIKSKETQKSKEHSWNEEGRSGRSPERSNKNRRSRNSRSRSRSREKYANTRSEYKGLLKPSNDVNPPLRSTSMFVKPKEEDSARLMARAARDNSSTSNRGWQKKEFRPSVLQAPKKSSKSSSSSSSSSSDSEDERHKYAEKCEEKNSIDISEIKNTETAVEKPPAPTPTPIFLNDKEMNELAAKIMKAEMLGNDSQVAKLKTKMESAQAARASGAPPPSTTEGDGGSHDEVVLLTKTDAKGNVRPVSTAESEDNNRKKKKKVKTHGKDGQRDRYFPDDDNYDLKTMFEKEKGTSAEEQNSLYEGALSKNHERLNDDYDVDDMFMDKATQRMGDEKQSEMERNKAIKEHQRTQRSLDSCQWCFDSAESLKHLIVALGSKVYLSLPSHESLTPGHCIIVPIQHTQCAVQADEDLWNEVQVFRKSLVRLFESRGEDCIFFEMARNFRNLPHMAIHCIPLPKETGDMAPIYFKKAIMECEGMWAQNKKLVELKGRDVRRAIPKGLPYFFVDFAMMDGYAHVIEDEQTFPKNFAQEIVGGMLDVEVNLWRKPRKENFDAQRRKVMHFSTWYKEFDPTRQ